MELICSHEEGKLIDTRFLKVGGGVVISIKANCIDSTAAPEQVFAQEVQKLKAEKIKPFEQITLEPFERGRFSS